MLALATCWNVTRGPQNNSRWYLGLDNIAYTADDLSLNVDNVILKQLYPGNCPSAIGCDVIRYKIQWFNGAWSDYYFPGVNDVYQKSGENARHYWACFNDHTHLMEYCN